ncbi:hypothetical protein IV38_GL001938 [Lactobacillus selangorensis]|uniref:HTH cro/C1-type domain-containing protein n=1 Tax=Lactobacillus selangorensis TaxID=81857 RepID=A0A0R2FSJ5_9LACO|nr:hypothetical protein IV38_GL001938 [Lactobacillus selangorensis]KRN30310.1 hypothetical protein IV40_GL001899 [Lactobacillus selangorensis]
MVKGLAQKKSVSVAHIERELKFANGSISKWDKSVPRADRLQEVADYLGVTTTFILNKSKEESK